MIECLGGARNIKIPFTCPAEDANPINRGGGKRAILAHKLLFSWFYLLRFARSAKRADKVGVLYNTATVQQNTTKNKPVRLAQDGLL